MAAIDEEKSTKIMDIIAACESLNAKNPEDKYAVIVYAWRKLILTNRLGIISGVN